MPTEPPRPPDSADDPERREPDRGDAEVARFPIVGIGASSGGLEAAEQLIAHLASDGMAFVVVQHVSPDHKSQLADILARHTTLGVITIEDGIEIQQGTIHVAPPDREVTLRDGHLYLAEVASHAPRHGIDTFFRSLAAELGPMAIGVVLSGSGTDGTLGIAAIKESGGITFAQDPASAGQPSMPQSVISSGNADFCLEPGAIGDELMRLSVHPYVARRRTGRTFGIEPLKRLFEQLRSAFGVDFSSYKLNTVERRIERRMVLHKFERVDEYVRFIESNAEELAQLYTDLLIGVTGFFRDHEPFEALKAVVFPRMFERRSNEVPIRVWVPGCATGEEAYSLAMCLLEYLDGRVPSFKIQIFGTDIDDHALTRARQAQYPQNIDLDVSSDRLRRFFSRYDKGYQVSRQIRDMVVFARHNLGKDPPFSRLDLISCRNVLIYMQPPLQRKVLRLFHHALNPDGYLLLGTSESVGDASDLFSLLDRKLKVHLKKNIPSPGVFDFAFGARSERVVTAPVPAVPTHERRPTVSIQQLADRKVLEKFGPPGVLLDEHMDVIQFRGQMGPYLGPAPGVATLNVMKLVRPELLIELRTLLQTVASEGLPRVSDPVPLFRGQNAAAVVLDVMPLQETTAESRCYLVLFRAVPQGASVEQPVVRASEEAVSSEPRVQELERELLVTKEYLQSTVQELEAANEELQSSNEELQSSNEELQSTNEELETSKEELQSTNEELATVNDELQNRMAQLSISNDDLNNVLAGVSTPFVIVGMDLRIRRFSADAERLLSLIPGDVGRPIGYLATGLNVPQLESVVSETINSVRERGQRVRCSDGHWYTARIIPYRTADHSIRGALIEFLRAPPSRRIGETPEINELAGKVLSMLPHVVMLLDEQMRIAWVNKAFFEAFVLGTEILGRSLEDLWLGRESHPEVWSALEDTAAGIKPFTEVWLAHLFGRKSDRPMRISARYVAAEGDRPALTVVVMEEASGVEPNWS